MKYIKLFLISSCRIVIISIFLIATLDTPVAGKSILAKIDNSFYWGMLWIFVADFAFSILTNHTKKKKRRR